MYEVDKRLFVGIKISANLQVGLDNCACGTEHYLKEDTPEALQIVTLGAEKLIGRFLRDGFPVSDIDNVSRNVRSIVQLVAPRYRVQDNSIQIYADCTVRSVIRS
ncbi:MAG: hypothetical protein HY694_18335 [Deltaproteobacteria bacterium]|nr:hypothetical protein [Deltaproteobacteria bacterium]